MEDKLGRHMKEMCGELGEKYMKSILSEIKALSSDEEELAEDLELPSYRQRRAAQEQDNDDKNRVNDPSAVNPGGALDLIQQERKNSSYQKLKKKFDTTLMGIKKLYKALDKIATMNGISLGSKSIKKKNTPNKLDLEIQSGIPDVTKKDPYPGVNLEYIRSTRQKPLHKPKERTKEDFENRLARMRKKEATGSNFDEVNVKSIGSKAKKETEIYKKQR